MHRKIMYLIVLAIGLAIVVGNSNSALADDFYKGKTIRFVVGYAPGGGYDTYTRAVVRHMGKHITGNPTPIVQNMTGGGSLIAANYIYKRAKPDGLTVGIWNSGIILQQVLGGPGIKFKADKFGWVGAPVQGWPTCAIMGYTGLKTLKDVMNTNQRIKVGATRAGSTTDDLPKILNQTLGTNFDVISGYTGTATIRIAMQKQEVDAACWGWESMGVTARAMLDASGEDQLIPFLIHGTLDDPQVKDLPQILNVIKGQSNLATFKAWASTYDFQRPLSLPPGTPKARLATLRKAYRATMNDPAFLADAKKSKLIISYVSGKEIEKHVATILGTPAAAKEKLGFLVRKKKKN
jgi:tripartite-type tricarboxylate transporter receptor subunit TctC